MAAKHIFHQKEALAAAKSPARWGGLAMHGGQQSWPWFRAGCITHVSAQASKRPSDLFPQEGNPQ